jgi:hypothetical protein
MVWDLSKKSETDIDEIESLSISYAIPPELVLPAGTHNISYGEAGKVIVVGKEVGETMVNLPKGVAAGAKLTFQVEGEGPLKIVPFKNDRISAVKGISSAVKSSKRGRIVLECAGQGLWRVVNEIGKWTYSLAGAKE